MRIGIIGLLQESNTFIEGRTTRRHFQEDLLLRGEAIREAMAQAPHEVGGFFEVLDEAGCEVVPIFLARALPYGRIVQEDFEQLVEEMLAELAAAGPLDGLLAAPHGATVAEGYPDADGYWLGRLRSQLGPDFPLVATLDLHANLSEAMLAATQALVSYRMNPHLDQRETGKRAAELLLRTVKGLTRLTQAAAFPPMAVNIRCQNTSEPPMSEYYAEAEAIASRPGVLSYSILHGFPYADVPEMGSAVLVVTDSDEVLAQETADQLARRLWERREDFEPVQIDASEALRLAAERPERPVILLDMGDNVGGGSPANSTEIPRAWLAQGSQGRLFICLHDPEAVEAAQATGVGGHFTASVGDPAAPLTGRYRVRSLHEGIFRETQPRHGGFSVFDQGPTALLELEGADLVVMATTRRMTPFSLAQLSSCDVDPYEFDWIVAKGVIAPMAAYAPVARGGFLHVDTAGATRADMTKLCHHHRRRPLFPFERETRYER